MAILKSICPRCGHKNANGKFCSECGITLTPTEKTKNNRFNIDNLKNLYRFYGILLIALIFILIFKAEPESSSTKNISVIDTVAKPKAIFKILDIKPEVKSDQSIQNRWGGVASIAVSFTNEGNAPMKLENVNFVWKLKNVKTGVVEWNGNDYLKVNATVNPKEIWVENVDVLSCNVGYRKTFDLEVVVNDTILINQTIHFK